MEECHSSALQGEGPQSARKPPCAQAQGTHPLSAQQTFIRCKPTSASASLWVKTQAYLRWVETDRFAQALLGRTRL
jgi:hypothetical protein